MPNMISIRSETLKLFHTAPFCPGVLGVEVGGKFCLITLIRQESLIQLTCSSRLGVRSDGFITRYPPKTKKHIQKEDEQLLTGFLPRKLSREQE